MKRIIVWALGYLLCFMCGIFVGEAIALEATTSMTIIKTDEWWPNSTCASPPAVVNYKITERVYNVRIKTNGLSYSITPGNTFEGGYARLWGFWSNNGGKSWVSSGWDYTTNNATFKSTHGYGTGNDWVGQAISTICDQSRCPKDPNACNGRQRSNVIFVPNPDNRPVDNSLLKIMPEDVGVFYELGKQQFKAYKDNIDVSNNVDWYIEEYPFTDQSNNAIIIDNNGLATITDSWGRVNIKACYPKGCHDSQPTLPDNTAFLHAIYLLTTGNAKEHAEHAISWMGYDYIIINMQR